MFTLHTEEWVNENGKWIAEEVLETLKTCLNINSLGKEEEERGNLGWEQEYAECNADSGVSRNERRLWLAGGTDIFPFPVSTYLKVRAYVLIKEVKRTAVWDQF